jgi:hypothetical protein
MDLVMGRGGNLSGDFTAYEGNFVISFGKAELERKFHLPLGKFLGADKGLHTNSSLAGCTHFWPLPAQSFLVSEVLNILNGSLLQLVRQEGVQNYRLAPL